MVKILFYVPIGAHIEATQLGGQVTAARALVMYARAKGWQTQVIDSRANYSSRFKNFLLKIKATKKCLHGLVRFAPTSFILFSGGERNLLEKLPVLLLANLLGIPSTVCLRNDRLMRVDKRSRRFIVKQILRLSTNIVVQGSAMKSGVRELVGSRPNISVVANWLTPDMPVSQHPKLLSNGDVIRFSFVSLVTKDKGVYELVEAANSLSKMGYPFELVIAGDGDALAQSKQLCSAEEVSFKGWLSKDEISELYESSHVFVLPSYREGFPNSVVEAMASGLPIIVTPVGAVADSVVSNVNGILINARDIDSLTDAMKRYIVTPSLVSAHSEAAIKTVLQRHDYQKNCEKVFN